MTIYALDTNIISFMLRGDENIWNAFLNANTNGDIFIIPVAAYYEVKRGLLAVNATAQIRAFEQLCNNFDIEEMSVEAWEKSAQIWAYLIKRGMPLGKDDGDIFIGAHSLVNGYTVVTDNEKDFSRIDGLKFVNWKS